MHHPSYATSKSDLMLSCTVKMTCSFSPPEDDGETIESALILVPTLVVAPGLHVSTIAINLNPGIRMLFEIGRECRNPHQQSLNGWLED